MFAIITSNAHAYTHVNVFIISGIELIYVSWIHGWKASVRNARQYKDTNVGNIWSEPPNASYFYTLKYNN